MLTGRKVLNPSSNMLRAAVSGSVNSSIWADPVPPDCFRLAVRRRTKAAQRILLESMARRLGPDGIHVAYVAIDAVIDLEWTRKRFADQPDGFFIQPDDIAAEVRRIAEQPRSAWSFNVEIRPYGETW